MAESDPLVVLAAVADDEERPDPVFSRRLLGDLVANLHGTETAESEDEHLLVIDIINEGNGPMKSSRTNRWLWPLLAAAAVIVIVGVAVAAFASGDDDGSPEVIASDPDSTADQTVDDEPDVVAPEPSADDAALPEEPEPDSGEEPASSGTAGFDVDPPVPAVAAPHLTVDTARALLDAIGGDDGLALGSIADDGQFTMVSFDPGDNKRVLADDFNWFAESIPTVWTIDSGGVTAAPFNDVGGRSTAVFQPDGTVSQIGTDSLDEAILVSSASGDPIGEVVVGFGVYVYDGRWGDRAANLVSGVGGPCPYNRLMLGTPGGPMILDEQPNAFARASVIGPDALIAFPYLPDLPECEPLAATETVVWDLETGDLLPEHPLAGLPLARAVVSGDGSRALVLDADGQISVLSMATGESVSELGSFDVRSGFHPLALNHNGTLAVVIEDDGRVTLWHVDSGELLLEASSDPRTTGESPRAVGAVAYDATRVALIDDTGSGAWTFLTLDPNEWLGLACDAGFELSDEERTANGFDPSVTC